jgi:hypothetical protein
MVDRRWAMMNFGHNPRTVLRASSFSGAEHTLTVALPPAITACVWSRWLVV